jgi:ABC-2 type transport system permease protein
MNESFFFRLKARRKRRAERSTWIILAAFTRANLKASDYGTALGLLWSAINPLAMLAVMYFIFSMRFGAATEAYPLYILIGIVVVNFFISATTYMLRNFSSNRRIVLNSMIPRECLILAQLSTQAFKFIVEIGLCALLGVVLGFFSWKMPIMLIPLLLAFILFVASVGMILALIYCFAKDIEHVWLLVTRLLYFLTPVFFTMDSISPLARNLVFFANPLSPFVTAIRSLLMGQPGGHAYMLSLVWGCGLFIISYSLFISAENSAIEQV